ncbi:MAG TPA: PepSY domain-containing protein [Bacillota bacterium]|nr:PepSY domain-containing protein [Bacillota bacterium]
MKKKIALSVGVLAIASVLGLGIYHSNASQAEPKLSSEEIDDIVTSQYPGTITEMELEKDFNQVIYEVEITEDGNEYELKLDGNTGEVLKIKEKEMVKKQTDNIDQHPKKKQAQQQANDQVDQKNQSQSETNENRPDQQDKRNQQKTVIDADEAVQIALKEFSGTVESVELDEDDHRLIYEVEIEAGDEEAEVEIDAYTGEVLVIDIDD